MAMRGRNSNHKTVRITRTKMMTLDKDKILPAASIIAMSDDEVEEAFLRLLWPTTDGSPQCPRCDCQKIYHVLPRGCYKCSDCLHNFTSTSGTPFSSRKMTLRSYMLAISLFARKANALQVSQEMGFQYATAYRLANILKDMGVETQVGRRKKSIYLKCANCGVDFLDKMGDQSSALRRGKSKRVFCSHGCYGEFSSKSKESETCKRCKKSRRELSPFQNAIATGVSFNHGYCERCYGLLKAYNWDEALCQSHEFNQQLKKESTNVNDRKKHSRPPESTSRGNRGSAQGECGSPAGSSDQCSFFAHLAVSTPRL
jgi:transposase-like protein